MSDANDDPRQPGSTPDSPILVWTPPALSTVKIADRAYLRVEVNPEEESTTPGTVFNSRSRAAEALAEERTLLPDSSETAKVDLPGREPVFLQIGRRQEVLTDAIIRVSIEQEFSVARLVLPPEEMGTNRPKPVQSSETFWVGIAVARSSTPDTSSARAATSSSGAQEQGRAVRVPAKVGIYDVAAILPTGNRIATFRVEVALPLTSEEGEPEIVPAELLRSRDWRAYQKQAVAHRSTGGIPIVPAAPKTNRAD